MTFENIIEEIKVLPFEMKLQLHQLLEKYVVEERRSEIKKNYKKSQREYKNGKLDFSSNMDQLKRML